MKFEWKYRYVEDGQLTPDKFNRWAIDCYVFVNIKNALPKYEWCLDFHKDGYLPVRVATMLQKGCDPRGVPSVIDNFCVTMPTFEDAGNLGMSTQRNFFSNDIEELKRIVENQFCHIQLVFSNMLNSEQNVQASVATEDDNGTKVG